LTLRSLRTCHNFRAGVAGIASTALVLTTTATTWAAEPGRAETQETASAPRLTKWYAAEVPTPLQLLDAQTLARTSPVASAGAAEGGPLLYRAPTSALSPFAPTPKKIRLSDGAIVAIIVGAIVVTALVIVGVVVLAKPHKPPRP
jgi:hypothetical protein